MKELIPIDGWSTPTKLSYAGKYQDKQGRGLSGFYKRLYKDSIHVIALNNGTIMRCYIIPDPLLGDNKEEKLPFQSPMVRWFNLHFCGGWGVVLPNGKLLREHDLINAVVTKQKPCCLATAISKRDLCSMTDKLDKAGLPYKTFEANLNFPRAKSRYHLWAAQNGTLNDNFDMNAFVKTYQIFDSKYPMFSYKVIDKIKGIANDSMFDTLLSNSDLDTESSYTKLILVGLLFGYSIESTMACMFER